MLFDNIQTHKVSIPAKDDEGANVNVKSLIPWLCKNIMRDSRKELFVQEGSMYVALFLSCLL